jgi:hypothetical protein
MKKINYYITNYCSYLCLVTVLLLLGMTNSLRDPTQPLNFKVAPTKSNDICQDFNVRAIFADDTNTNPRAIIGCCLFKVGDEIAGHTIADITREGVILKDSYGEEVFATIGNNKIKYQTESDEENRS